jgi:hypothetical protein
VELGAERVAPDLVEPFVEGGVVRHYPANFTSPSR